MSEIIHSIHNSGGYFIKPVGPLKNSSSIECNEAFTREKVTQSLRDTLSFKYSSSTKRKKERKAKVQEVFYGDIDKIVHSNVAVSIKVYTLEQQVRYANYMYGNNVPDDIMLGIFHSANLDLLETIKKDQSMAIQLQYVMMNDDNSTAPTNSRSISRNHNRPTYSFSSSFTSAPRQFGFTSSNRSPVS